MEILGANTTKLNPLGSKVAQEPLLTEGRKGVGPGQTTEKGHSEIIRVPRALLVDLDQTPALKGKLAATALSQLRIMGYQN